MKKSTEGSNPIELTEEEFEKVREEMLMWFSRNGFLIEERREHIVLKPRSPMLQERDNEYTLDSTFKIVSASGEFASKKKREYVQAQIYKQLQYILNTIKD